MNEFLYLRIKLDHAITFGDDALALMIAQRGLDLGTQKNLPAEIEYFRAQFFILEEDFTTAIVHLNKAIDINPKDGAAFNDKALCLVELGQLDNALENFNKGILVEPDYASVYHNKGWLLNKLGLYSDAVECFLKTLELEPKRAVTYENLGDAYLNLRLVDDAKKAYNRALEFLPSDCQGIKEQIEDLLSDLS